MMRVVLLGLSQLEIDQRAQAIETSLTALDNEPTNQAASESLIVRATEIIVNSIISLPADDQNRVLLKLVEDSGSKPAMVDATSRARKALAEGKGLFKPMTKDQKVRFAVWSVLATASVAVSAYHGAKRHRGSAGWGLVWGVAGGFLPIITPVVAVAQGYGKPMK